MPVQETSKKSYKELQENLGERQMTALRMVDRFGPGTRMEILMERVENSLMRIIAENEPEDVDEDTAKQVIKMAAPHHFQPRVTELIEEGCIEVTGKHPCDYSDKQSQVIDLTDKGERVVEY